MPSRWYADRAIDFIREHRGEPWFIQIGFPEPHSPFWFPVEYAHRYSPGQMQIPQPGPEDAGQIPKVFNDLTLAEKQGIKASYYTSVAWLDANVGRVLDALDQARLSDNTLVIYVGDNGYHLGEHGRFEKHTLYERNVRVPLIVRLPGRIGPGRSSRALVELVDLVPTVLDYTGIPRPDLPPPRDLHGHSLEPLIARRVETVRSAVFSEYQHTQEAMVRTERFKLIYRTSVAATDWYEPIELPKGRGVRLYDLEHDPEEMRDVSGVPENRMIVDDLLDRLAAWYRDFPFPANLSREEFLDWAIAPRKKSD